MTTAPTPFSCDFVASRSDEIKKCRVPSWSRLLWKSLCAGLLTPHEGPTAGLRPSERVLRARNLTACDRAQPPCNSQCQDDETRPARAGDRVPACQRRHLVMVNEQPHPMCFIVSWFITFWLPGAGLLGGSHRPGLVFLVNSDPVIRKDDVRVELNARHVAVHAARAR